MPNYTPGVLNVYDADGTKRALRGWWTDDAPPQFVSEHRPELLMNLFSGEIWKSGVASFVRPGDVTAYTAPTSSATGDLVANSTVAGAVVPLEFDIAAIAAGDTAAEGEIAFVKVNTTGNTAKSLRVHFYSGTDALKPTVSAGDNAAIAVSNHAEARYLGFADVTLQPGPGGVAVGVNDLVRIPYELVKDVDADNEKVFVLIEALTAYTPSNAGSVSVQIGARRTR